VCLNPNTEEEIIMRVCSLHFDETANRWMPCQSTAESCTECEECGYCHKYILPDEDEYDLANLKQGFESKFSKGRALYPMFEKRRLQRDQDARGGRYGD